MQSSTLKTWGIKTACTALLIAAAGAVAAGGVARADPQPASLPEQLVHDFHSVFGDHHARAVHAKGVILEGSFQPGVDAKTLSAASVFAGRVPVTIRFSDFTGLPEIPDASPDANPRGFALKFQLADGATYDVVTHSFNGFPVATGEDFGVLLTAIAQSGPTAAKPTPLDRYFAEHERAKVFFTTQKPAPESFATAAFFGVNAFTFTNASGLSQTVRYRFVPEAGEHYLKPAELKTRASNYLMEEIGRRVAQKPVRFTWLAQIAEAGDRVDDPSVAWPESRRLVKLGVITIDKLGANDPAADRALLFLPGNVPDGIGIADPMIDVRNAAYPVSAGERQ